VVRRVQAEQADRPHGSGGVWRVDRQNDRLSGDPAPFLPRDPGLGIESAVRGRDGREPTDVLVAASRLERRALAWPPRSQAHELAHEDRRHELN
jgi:hypothetical protein